MTDDVAAGLVARKARCAKQNHRASLTTARGNCQTCLTVAVELAASGRDPVTGQRQ